MGNQVLRPSGPTLGTYNTAWGVTPASVYWEAIDDVIPDGDASYLHSDVALAPFTVRLNQYLHSGAGKPTKVVGLLVMATMRLRDSAPFGTFRFRLRAFGKDFDSEDYPITSQAYQTYYKWYDQVPNGTAWTAGTLHELELGIVLVDGGGNQLRCTKLEAHVLTDAIADLRVNPANLGTASDWDVHPATSLNYQAVSGAWDGDLSYLFSNTASDSELIRPSSIGSLSLPNIDKVQVIAAARTPLAESLVDPRVKPILYVGGSSFVSGTHDLSTTLPLAVRPRKYAWSLLVGEFYTDPSSAWPDGASGSAPWTLPQLNALEIGIDNEENVEVRCSQLALDVFLSPTPSTVLTHLPLADSAQFHDLPGVSPVKAYPNIWENVDEDPPDDSGSYIGADATLLGAPAVGTFAVGGGGIVPVGERVWSVQSSCRLQLGSSSSALVALCVNDAGSSLTIGRPRWISGTAGAWFNLYEDWYTNPSTGQAWGSLEPESMEWGVVVLEGEAFFSQVKVDVRTRPEFTAATDASVLSLTTSADQLILDSTSRGIVYQVESFGVGTGGFNPAIPTTVLPVTASDTSLVNEVYKSTIDKVTMVDLSPGTRVTYWCRVPRSALVGNQIGEVGLYVKILWSLYGVWPVDSEHLFAIGHNPGQVMVEDDVVLFKLSIDYP